ncbi:MAG: acyltransferase [Oscillospiraceae bacterium]|nr:acyltransferase [Oscillospiraceae bacterium]
MKERGGFGSLTSLKGLFIWIIVLHNSFLIDAVFESVPGMPYIRLYGGSLGNSMFFMLSGFLMVYGYRERIAEGRISFDAYITRRLKKLYPMYAVTNLAALAVAVWQYGISAVNLRKVAFTFLLLQGSMTGENPYNSPTWFVAALLLCYILFYAVTSVTKTKTQYRFCLAAAIVWGYYLHTAQMQMPFCYPGNGSAFLNFFLGSALAELFPLLEKNRKWLKPSCFVSLLLCAYLLWGYGVEVISGDSAVAFSFVICPMILYLSWEEGLCSRVLRWKPLVMLGKISMDVFYWHLVLYLALRQLLNGMTKGGYTFFVLGLLVLSGISFTVREKIRSVRK